LENLLAITCTLLGLMVGSFLNVVVYRLPRGLFFEGGARSRCPSCGRGIAWFDNLPVLSWLLLRGRARCCGARISLRYPILELLAGLAFLLLFLGKSARILPDGEGISLEGVLDYLVDAFLVANLLAASAIDLEFRILPDVLNFLGFLVGAAAAVFLPESHLGHWLAREIGSSPEAARALLDGFAGAALGAGALYLVAWIGTRIYKTEAMGLGDVKFMAFTGVFLGPEGTLLALLLACILGALLGLLIAFRTGDPKIPFGPFLAAGTLCARFAGETLAEALFEDWPLWLRTSRYGALALLGISALCLAALFFLRSLRRGRSRD